jgi:MFS family permease
LRPSPPQVARAIRLSYAQMMLGAVFGASTGGMFLIGFAMRLGADNVLLGLLSTAPQFFVVIQFLAAFLVERQCSRKRLTIVFAFVTPLAWFLIAAIPFFEPVLSKAGGIAVLISVIILVTAAAQFAGNARGSWIGDLIPAARRGRFFGYCGMFGGIVGAVFAIAEGGFLDFVQSHGLLAFTALFLFGSLFGLASAALNIPQPDCPLPGTDAPPPFLRQVRGTLRNRPLVMLAIVHAILAMGGIAGPFNAAYLLRDVGLTFFSLGLLNSVFVAAMLMTAPLWGRLADRFGCRPVLTLGLWIMAPCGLVWLAIPPGAAAAAYYLLPWTNFACGIGAAAVNVAITTMMYKVSRPEGRSVQFAAYSVFISVVSAPMPLLGGWLVSALEGAGHAVDLRLTFYLWILFVAAAAVMSRLLQEPDSLRTRTLVFRYFPARLAALLSVAVSPFFSALGSLEKFQLPAPKGDDPPEDDGK